MIFPLSIYIYICRNIYKFFIYIDTHMYINTHSSFKTQFKYHLSPHNSVHTSLWLMWHNVLWSSVYMIIITFYVILPPISEILKTLQTGILLKITWTQRWTDHALQNKPNLVRQRVDKNKNSYIWVKNSNFIRARRESPDLTIIHIKWLMRFC